MYSCRLGTTQSSKKIKFHFINVSFYSPKLTLLMQESDGLCLSMESINLTKYLWENFSISFSRHGKCPHVSHAKSAVIKIIRFHIKLFVNTLIPRGLTPTVYTEWSFCFNFLLALSVLSKLLPSESISVPA